jgi:hypothetical protein
MKIAPVSINTLVRPLKAPIATKTPRQDASAAASSERGEAGRAGDDGSREAAEVIQIAYSKSASPPACSSIIAGLLAIVYPAARHRAHQNY